ncbi:Protein Asterix [Apostasia shenzhenica]|uniref:Protein Asterix n=1 Tax=Apostasia shenzhenica TaxID=1088818 RepID=A0A2I0A481_9ASPA|nr:Protein Asterix [Apostasia shenzhenica]
MRETRETSSSTADPRQPPAVKPYAPPRILADELPFDYAGFLAVIFGITGLMFRYKICSWLAIIFVAKSLANMKNMENDLRQTFSAVS